MEIYMKGKWSSGKLVALIFGSMAAGMLLLGSFCISVFLLLEDIGRKSLQAEKENGDYKPYEAYEEGGDESYRSYEDAEDEEAREESIYYDFHNEVRSDLSYQIRMEELSCYYGDNDNVLVKVEYPVVSSVDSGGLDGINAALYREVDEIKRYAESVADQLGSQESYAFEAECLVTYMDEEKFSIVYRENGYLNEEGYESYVIPVNIDMESKMALTNTQLLDIDDAFSIDFRERCEKQNGEIAFLESFSDQDITELLTDTGSLIIFYTPMGMEVGFNYYYGWVTVTYRDYQKYRSHI